MASILDPVRKIINNLQRNPEQVLRDPSKLFDGVPMDRKGKAILGNLKAFKPVVQAVPGATVVGPPTGVRAPGIAPAAPLQTGSHLNSGGAPISLTFNITIYPGGAVISPVVPAEVSSQGNQESVSTVATPESKPIAAIPKEKLKAAMAGRGLKKISPVRVRPRR